MSTSEPTIQQLFDLTGRVALVTGGTGYLGSAMSRALAEAGARVVISSRDRPRAEAAAAELPAVAGQEHVGVGLDHLVEESLNAGFDEALAKAGQVDILVNNGQFPTAADWRSTSGEEFSQQLANATGYFLLSRRMRDHVVERATAGSIIVLGSMYGVVASYPEVYEDVCPASPVAYHALKGGIVHMTRHLAAYWGADRVRVNCLSPGPFPQPKVHAELVARISAKTPLGRIGSPHELKGAIVYLASEASSYVTGQNLLVDGGWTAW